MKKFLLALGLAAAVSGSAAVAAGDQDFVLINHTGLTIHELYVTPTAHDEWGEDILGRDVLKDNEKVEITFSRKEDECVWDLKIVDEDGDSVEWEKINLCKASEITLYYKGKRPTADIR